MPLTQGIEEEEDPSKGCHLVCNCGASKYWSTSGQPAVLPWLCDQCHACSRSRPSSPPPLPAAPRGLRPTSPSPSPQRRAPWWEDTQPFVPQSYGPITTELAVASGSAAVGFRSSVIIPPLQLPVQYEPRTPPSSESDSESESEDRPSGSGSSRSSLSSISAGSHGYGLSPLQPLSSTHNHLPSDSDSDTEEQGVRQTASSALTPIGSPNGGKRSSMKEQQ